VQPKAHQFKFADLNKMVPTDPLKLIVFSSSVKQPTRQLAFLRRLPRTRSSKKEKKTAHLPAAHSRKLASNSIVATSISTTIEATNPIITIANLTIVIETIDATIVLNATTRT
jgi:hypothetical protein